MSEEKNPQFTESDRPVVRKETTVERVDPFHLPIFQFNDVISDEQCDALIGMCEGQEWESSAKDQPSSNKFSSISIDHHILDRIPDMKEFFELFVQDLSKQVLQQNTEGFNIGTSWCTKTTVGQTTSIHKHTNYYMSGILYLQEDNRLVVENPWTDLKAFHIEPFTINQLTCNSAMIRTNKNSMLLLPAWLKHSVPLYDREEPRYSIVMNFYPVGEYGTQTSSITVK